MMTFLITKLLLFFFIWYSMICLSSSIPSEYSILGDDLDKFTSDKEVLGLFQLWQKEHEREYQNLEEEANRFEIFKSNLKYIREKNAKRKSPYDYRLGLNKFSDMTYEEFSKIYLPKMESITQRNRDEIELSNESCENPPASLDWRKKGAVTKVKNQGKCGSCWAFSAIGSAEGKNAIVTRNLVTLSEQELVDCNNRSHGCSGGSHRNALQWIATNKGVASEYDYPYTAKDGTCKANVIKNAVTITGYKFLLPSENSLFCAVVNQPVSVNLLVTNDFKSYGGGIYDGTNCQHSCDAHNHGVLIVGYDSVGGKDYWIVKNSWGKDWGLEGYIWIKRNTGYSTGVCNINCWGAYPTIGDLVKRDRSSI